MWDDESLITTERVGLTLYTLVTWDYATHAPPTAADLACAVGLTENGMGKMLRKLERVLPLRPDGGGWRLELQQESPAG